MKNLLLQAKNKIFYTLTKTDADFINLISSWLLLLWGVWLLLPFNTFETSILYETLHNIFKPCFLSENFWGSIFLIVGLFQLISFIYLILPVQKLSMYFSFMVWTILSCISIYHLKQVPSISFVFHSIMAISTGIIYLRMGKFLKNQRRIT